jgi:zinc/manganese transport system substrate-binding protein/manganese/iron transport system substrate-binding protein
MKRQSGSTIRVLATTTEVQDFVRNVGGDRIAVIPVMQPDEDPHDYQPTAADARAFSDADVIFANGVGLETWFDSLAANARPGVPVVKLGEQSGIALRGGDADEPLGDPHVWFDPTNVQRMVANIRDTLDAVDPAGQTTYDANAAAYIGQLDQLDRDIMAQWATVPTEQRRLVTNHDALGYYVDRYGLTFVGSVIPSLSSEAQPSAAETQRLIQAIRAQGVRAIFTESSINPQLAQQIAQQAGVRVYSNLYGDTLGKPGSGADTYVAMMRYDTQTMVAGMTGQ